MIISFVGDVMLGRLVNEVLKNKPSSYPWGNTLKVLNSADQRFCNLECVISDRGSTWNITPKMFHFRSDAKNINVLKDANINAVSLANNHILDFGYEAMFETQRLLSRADIKNAGAGVNFDEASEPAIWENEGKMIGFLAFTDNEPVWEANAERPGVFYVPIDSNDDRARTLFEIVKATKEKTDILIVSTHWGENWGYSPKPEHISFAHDLIDKGADIVFGHSAHVFRGIEIYKDRPILYSAGDFIDDYAVDEIERNDESFVFMIDIEPGNLRGIILYPTVIKNFQARLAKGNEAENIALKMQTLSAEFQTPFDWNAEKTILTVKT